MRPRTRPRILCLLMPVALILIVSCKVGMDCIFITLRLLFDIISEAIGSLCLIIIAVLIDLFYYSIVDRFYLLFLLNVIIAVKLSACHLLGLVVFRIEEVL